MTKTLNTTFAAALVAASVFGASAAFAGGDYYPGGSPDAVQSQTTIDSVRTSSIGDKRLVLKHTASDDQRNDRGEYRSVAPVNGN